MAVKNIKIDIDKFNKEIIKLGFYKNNNVYEKKYANNIKIKIDFINERIIYPSDIFVNDETTSNFSHSENFVVLECINRLLEKGYRAEHIELEKKWTLGHTAKGGKADIIIYKNSKKEEVLLIIECKTYGAKYKEEYQNIIKDGGQLFSYWQQENSTQWLSIYASDFINNEVVYKNDTICCLDDNNLILSNEKNSDVLLYKDACKAEEKHLVWTETYNSKFYQDIIFGEDTCAYQIGLKPLKKKNLTVLSDDDNVSDEFEEILRHNNVSDKDNAFNKLCALFICKLVDELTKSDNEVVDFQYKEGIDTYEILIDRLQNLYHRGMLNFMREDVFYIPTDYVKETFINYTGSNREETIDELNKAFRKLKFYSNNDFSFKDVHNEELFYQNGKILVEVVKLFEKYKIIYNEKQQFLGDLFEKLLNNGFKQNEGQYFTPTPIAKFMWHSLPLENFAKGKENYPKIIDYSCGAGHFLTEGIDVINKYLKQEDNSWVKNSIYGIEKDYRLARVSKISLFMNGAGDGNIIYGDGLENYEDKGIKNNSFDYIVANPPYSIKEFKRHLKLKNNKFELFDEISDKDGTIEILFMERIIQLLKDDGYCAVVLPTQALYSDAYSSVRKKLLENCTIVALCYLASGAFSATPQSTVLMFLQKKIASPKFSNIIKDTVEAVFSQKIDENKWKDKQYFEEYLSHIEIEKDIYFDFLFNEKNEFEIDDSSYLYQYKDLEKENVIKIEKEKFYYFCLCFKQEVLVVKSPVKTAELQKFLGYKWQKEEIEKIPSDTKLAGENYKDKDSLAFVINEYFNGKKVNSKNFEQYYFYDNLNSLIDYSNSKYTAKITTTNFKLLSDYPMVRLRNVLNNEIKIGKGNTAPKPKYLQNGIYPFVRAKNLNNLSNNNVNLSLVDKVDEEGVEKLTLFKEGTILFPVSGQSINTNNIAMLPQDAYCVSHLATIYIADLKVRRYIFYLLDAVNTSNLKEADSSYPTIKQDYVKNLLIPDIISNNKVLNKLLEKCDELNDKYNSTNMGKKDYKEKLFKIFVDENILKFKDDN